MEFYFRIVVRLKKKMTFFLGVCHFKDFEWLRLSELWHETDRISFLLTRKQEKGLISKILQSQKEPNIRPFVC